MSFHFIHTHTVFKHKNNDTNTPPDFSPIQHSFTAGANTSLRTVIVNNFFLVTYYNSSTTGTVTTTAFFVHVLVMCLAPSLHPCLAPSLHPPPSRSPPLKNTPMITSYPLRFQPRVPCHTPTTALSYPFHSTFAHLTRTPHMHAAHVLLARTLHTHTSHARLARTPRTHTSHGVFLRRL